MTRDHLARADFPGMVVELNFRIKSRKKKKKKWVTQECKIQSAKKSQKHGKFLSTQEAEKHLLNSWFHMEQPRAKSKS